MTTLGRLTTPEQFGEVILRVSDDGRMLRLKDVSRVEANARSQDVANRFDGKPTVGLAIFTLPDANALDTSAEIKAKMKELAVDFPEGVAYEIGYDTTPFIGESINEVVHALRDAIILVAAVVLIFLKGWRPAIIPLIAVPVAIVGTFAAMTIVGFSLNNLTLFGLVLAIGIVVDDAIVVVEAVEHHMHKGLNARDAAITAMQEVSGPIIAVGLVLSAVFVPCAFVSGIVGQFFRQFALTIAISTLISTFNSLTLSPALAALLLRPQNAKKDLLTRFTDFTLGWFFRLFDFGFNVSGRIYVRAIGGLLRVPMLVLIVYGGLLLLTGWGYQRLPTGFIPAQDKGYLIASVQMPDSTAAERTREVMARLDKLIRGVDGVKNVNSVAGNSFVLSAYGSNFGSMFIILKNFDERREPHQYGMEISQTIQKLVAKEFPEAMIQIFPPPAVSGLGRAGGFKIMIEDRGDLGLNALQQGTDAVVRTGNTTPGLAGLFTVYKASSPKLFVDIDRAACQSQGVNLGDVFSTLQGFLGSRYVNDFNRFGRTWQVIVQADANYRDQVEDLKRLKVRNNKGLMMPLGSVLDVRPIGGPAVLTRYNMYPAAAITGNTAPGTSTGTAIAQLEKVANQELPQAMAFEWTEITFLERNSTNTGPIVFGLSVVLVFLVLAALYESWALPLAVILVVPMCVLSAVAGLTWLKMDVNIFTQIGLIVLIGLACKNAILIVEFAKYKRENGASAREATLAACELRLRPIIMTSFAFILGVIPLVFAQGAGAEMRKALGVAVFYGMLGVTLFGIVLTPVFYYVIDKLSEARLGRSLTTRLSGWRTTVDDFFTRGKRRLTTGETIKPRGLSETLRPQPIPHAHLATTPSRSAHVDERRSHADAADQDPIVPV
ncbi:MAG: efflux RND transporter permease subunit [Pirellulales bacterium]